MKRIRNSIIHSQEKNIRRRRHHRCRRRRRHYRCRRHVRGLKKSKITKLKLKERHTKQIF